MISDVIYPWRLKKYHNSKSTEVCPYLQALGEDQTLLWWKFPHDSNKQDYNTLHMNNQILDLFKSLMVYEVKK